MNELASLKVELRKQWDIGKEKRVLMEDKAILQKHNEDLQLNLESVSKENKVLKVHNETLSDGKKRLMNEMAALKADSKADLKKQLGGADTKEKLFVEEAANGVQHILLLAFSLLVWLSLFWFVGLYTTY